MAILGKKKAKLPKVTGKPREITPPQKTSGPRAHRLSVAIGLDVDNQSHLLGKGPECNYMKLRDIGRELIKHNGFTTIDGKDIQLKSAAILRPGQRPPKRYKFRPDKAKATKKKPAKKD